MEERKRRVGIMGGTFDPIHVGHLIIAETVREALSLSEVLFIPASIPPHKPDQPVMAAEHRLVLVKLATNSNPFFQVLDIEFRRKGPSYSYDTLKALIQEYGRQQEFCFIIGGDEVNSILSWYRAEELFSLCHFAAAKRQGSPISLSEIRKKFGDAALSRIHLVTTPELEISSTDIRRRLQEGRSIRYLVPEEVEAYIYKEGLYQ